ncbi:TPA: hypothetical protein HA251_08650 [Candidatus Woesearchaeota archaeon]|nr:hypothetical protein [Candidatus Woesearchaeota archaeon]
MKDWFIYNRQFNKADVLQLYTLAIDNLGPLNRLNLQIIHYDGDGKGDGLNSFTLMNCALNVVDIESRIISANRPVQCSMQRYGIVSRRGIHLKNLPDDRLEVIIEGSSRSNERVKMLCDLLFSSTRGEY